MNYVSPRAPDRERPSLELDAERADQRAYHELTLYDVARECVRLSGQSGRLGQDETIRVAVSGGALDFVFSTAVGAQLMQSFADAEDTTVGWVREVEVDNFKTQERFRLGKAGGLEKLPRGHTAKHTTFGDLGEEYKIARYAKQFAADEMDIIDDRLGALLDIPMELGAAARQLRPDLVYSILLANASLGADNIALFHATHANLAEAGSALAAATLQAGISAIAKQTEGGRPLNIKAGYLLTPQDLTFAARVLLQSAQRIVAADSGGTLNPLLSENIEPRSDSRLGVTGVTDPDTGTAYAGSATNWFLTGDATRAPTIEVGYLRGTNRQPTVRSFVLDRGQWGIGWDVKLDIGAKALDYRAMYMATGAGE
ncbi:MAG: hypothetical protein ABIK89_23300 [Planctomycetota bacterium]